MYFLNRDPLFVTEKPYMFRFDIDTDEIPLTNTSFTKYSGMTVRDLRGQEHRFSIEKQGFAVLTLPREIRYEDYFDPNAVTEYFRSLEQLLVEYLGASKVEAFRHGVRLSINKVYAQQSAEVVLTPSADQETSRRLSCLDRQIV